MWRSGKPEWNAPILVRRRAGRNPDEKHMSHKKRTTVTTIETHEVWIIRRPASDVADEAEAIKPLEIAQRNTVSPLTKLNNRSETEEEDGL